MPHFRSSAAFQKLYHDAAQTASGSPDAGSDRSRSFALALSEVIMDHLITAKSVDIDLL